MEPQYACERKFSGPAPALPRATAVVEASCVPDGEFPEGVVNSIYFETPSLMSWREKDNGDNVKTKVRLRWYGRDEDAPETIAAFLEVKGRIGGARHKRRAGLRVPRALLMDSPLEDPALRALLVASLGEIAIPSPLSWTPAFLISYSRRRYFDAASGSRVSIDWDIRAPRLNRDMFPIGRPLALGSIVCEFKNHLGVPPPWAEELAACGLRLGGFSKFGEIADRITSGEL